MFNKLYQSYKDTFDLELRLYKSNMTYAELKRQQREAEGIEGFVAENQYGNLIKLKTICP